ncbi:geraniol 8-hydroxylase-like [Impatiens glandulifera]|uniref:geraniol 8-hydroxylase-like n=1 Tax=Impatiens glandulifera TaxID=253017 RepID=UPI001FB05042|nr:geraniol 8-hydroxylase-like [Impatiens glandulifera]
MAISAFFSDYSIWQMNAISFIILLFILYYAWILLINRFSNNPRSPPLPPGPTGLPIVGSLLSLDPELHTYFAALAHTHGPIFSLRLGSKLGVIISSPSTAREVLKDQDIIFANRDVPIAGKIVTYGGSDIVWNPYGTEWRMLRKVCVREMLSGTTLDSVYDLRRKEIRKTVNNLWVHGGSPVDVGEEMFMTMMNVITNMLWGGGDGKEEVGTEFRHVVAEITALLGKPNLSDFFPGLAKFDLQGVVKDMKILAQKFDKIFDSIIDERLSGNNQNKSKDFLQVLLNLKEEGNANMPLTMIHIKALLMDMVVGGTDTTSNSIEFALSEMINSPEVMKKAQQELESVVGLDHIVEESHIHQLPYLHAVMKETLRLHPALPLLVPHCPSKSCIVGGYSIPEGSRVFVNVWAIHRDPSIWKDPLKFDPERFTGLKGDYNVTEFNYFPFGSGRRICAGIGMAERMFLFLLASLVHSFEWKVSDGEKLDIEEKFGIVLKKKKPLMAIPTSRLSKQVLYE